MRPEDILDAIGDVDDGCIKEARVRKKERKKGWNRIWITVGAVAAGIVLVVSLPFGFIVTEDMGSAPPENSNQPDYVISRIDINIGKQKLSYAAREHTEPIADYIHEIFVTVQGVNCNMDFDENLQPGEISIKIKEHTGEENEYRLYGTYFYDINGGKRYELTKEELTEFNKLLGISEGGEQ